MKILLNVQFLLFYVSQYFITVENVWNFIFLYDFGCFKEIIYLRGWRLVTVFVQTDLTDAHEKANY